jgi:hypothetical protein
VVDVDSTVHALFYSLEFPIPRSEGRYSPVLRLEKACETV